MAKKQIKTVKTRVSLDEAEKKAKKSLFEGLDVLLGRGHKIIAAFITLLALALSFLLFDAKVSTGLDDSTYIQQGYYYAQDFFNHFFVSQAPFYAMILALPIAYYGINIILLKLLSILFFVPSVYILYRAFRYKVSWSVLFLSLFIYATNSELLKFASLTYTESLFLLIQSIFILLLVRLVDKIDGNEKLLKVLKDNVLVLILCSITFYFLFFTRTVGIAAVVAIGAYFFFRKNYKLMLLVPLIFAASYGFFEMLKYSIWSNIDQFGAQSKILLQKDAYDASQGNEDLQGFIQRFLENTSQYFSSRLYEILGFWKHPSEPVMSLALLTIIPLIAAMVRSIRYKQKVIMVTGLYTFAICGFTFLALQSSWGQSRYIMIVLPFMAMAYVWLFENWLSKDKYRGYQGFGLLFILVILGFNAYTTYKLARENIPVVQANIFGGDRYAGYTEDWSNYLKMSEWIDQNLAEDAFVASRKAPMAFLYSNGREFYPVWRLSRHPDADSLLGAFKEAGVTHVMVGTLRVNPEAYTGEYVNTMHRVLIPIYEKYPNCLVFIRQEGVREDTKLFELNYNAAVPETPESE